MSQEPIPVKLAYLLRDANSGAVVIQDLFHLGGTWTVRALLPGYPGSTTLGDFTIRLPPPYTDEFRRNAAQYIAILGATNKGIGLKVEAYNGGVVTGTPVLSGVITKMDLPMDGPWELSGSCTLFWLQQSQLFQGEAGSTGGACLDNFQVYLGSREALWDDDFSNWSGVSAPGAPASTDYTQTPGGSWTATTDPLFGLPALRDTVGGTVITNASWSSAQWATGNGNIAGSAVTAHAVLVPGTDATSAGSFGILLFSDATGANGWLAEGVLKSVAGGWNVGANIWSISGGAFTNQFSVSNVFTGVQSPFPMELTVVSAGTQPGQVNGLRVLINGKDTGLTSGIAPGGQSGRVGIRWAFNAGGTPTAYLNRLEFQARTAADPFAVGLATWGTNRFQLGSTISPASSLTYPGAVIGQGQTHLDVMQQMAAMDGALIRKNPGAGAKADSLDYLLSPGLDLSMSVVLEEGVNILAQDTTLQNVAEVFSGGVRFNFPPTGFNGGTSGSTGNDSGGSVTWNRLATPGDMILTDTVSDVGVNSYAAIIAYARAVQSRKAVPLTATQVRVARTADMLQFNNGWGPRELDFVQLHQPTYGVNHQKAQIVGYTITEGVASILYYVTQFPESRLAQAALQRLIRSVDYLGTTYAAR